MLIVMFVICAMLTVMFVGPDLQKLVELLWIHRGSSVQDTAEEP